MSSRVRARNVTSACQRCKSRKKRCDGIQPACSACVSLRSECVYDRSLDRRLLNRPHARVAALEQEIVELKARLAVLETHDHSSAARVETSPTDIATGLQHNESSGKLSYFGPTAIPSYKDQSMSGRTSRGWLPLPIPRATSEWQLQTLDMDSPERMRLVDLYFIYLNGLMGFVDEPEFRRGMKAGYPTVGYSHFLHLAVLNLASHLVAGWQTQATRDMYARRAFELLEDELAAPQPTTVIGIMLLMMDTADAGNLSLSWVYSGIANRLAQDLGLNVEASHLIATGVLSPQAARLRDDAFWTAYTHDTLLALYVGRSPSSAACDHSISWGQAAKATLPGCSEDLHGDQVALVKICDILSEIMKLLYSVKRDRRVSRASIERIAFALGSCLGENFAERGEMNTRRPTPNFIVLGALREAAVILLHRPFMHEPYSSTTHGQACYQAAIATLRFAQQFDLHYTIQKAPITMTQILYVATSVLVTMSDSTIWEPELYSLQHSVEAIADLKRLLACLSQTWRAASAASDALNRSLSAEEAAKAVGNDPALWTTTLFDWPLFEGLVPS